MLRIVIFVVLGVVALVGGVVAFFPMSMAADIASKQMPGFKYAEASGSVWDGKLTVAITAAWILIVLMMDLKKLKYAMAALLPLALGMCVMMGLMSMLDLRLNFMNIVVLPVVLGYGVSHGVYLLHRFLEGTSPVVALRSVGSAVLFSTLTTVAGFAALQYVGLRNNGV